MRTGNERDGRRSVEERHIPLLESVAAAIHPAWQVGLGGGIEDPVVIVLEFDSPFAIDLCRSILGNEAAKEAVGSGAIAVGAVPREAAIEMFGRPVKGTKSAPYLWSRASGFIDVVVVTGGEFSIIRTSPTPEVSRGPCGPRRRTVH